ncbi:hypothetical protein GW17_00054212, partial [Ensete ventricosum]
GDGIRLPFQASYLSPEVVIRGPERHGAILLVGFEFKPAADEEEPGRAYIVGVVDHPYLATRLPLWLTLSSYASTTSIVLAVRDASTGEGIGLTCVRSIVRLLGYRSYLCQAGRTTTGAPIPTSDQLIVLGRPRRRANYPKER